jgi:hypothetical protein
MNIFVPEYIALAIVLLIFGYHALKKLASHDEPDGQDMKNHQRTREHTRH